MKVFVVMTYGRSVGKVIYLHVCASFHAGFLCSLSFIVTLSISV